MNDEISRDETAFSVDPNGVPSSNLGAQLEATSAMKALEAGHIDTEQYNAVVAGELELAPLLPPEDGATAGDAGQQGSTTAEAKAADVVDPAAADNAKA